MKKNIFAFILGGIVFSSIAVIAVTQINANNVTYTDSSNNETTVEAALNDLYTTQTTTLAGLQNQLNTCQNMQHYYEFIVAAGNQFDIQINNWSSRYSDYKVSSTSNSGATCSAQAWNGGTAKLYDVVNNQKYSTSYENVSNFRLKLSTSGSGWCSYRVTYSN